MLKPETYRDQNGCHNCEFCFHWYEYDSPERYFCTKYFKIPEYCCSVAMNSHPFSAKLDSKKRSKIYDEWYDWSMRQEVKSFGICNEYSLKKD